MPKPARKRIRVALLDDLVLVRAGIGAILQEDRGLSVVFESGTSRDALAAAGKARPDVIVLDGPSGYATAQATTPEPPPAPPVPFVFRGVWTHFPTTDNGVGAGPGPHALAPPATLQAGDLYVIVATYRGSATLTLAQTGGQAWTSEPNAQAQSQTVRVFWCRFNGVWTGNPAVTNTSGTQPLTVYSFAFQMGAGMHPEVDVPFASGSHSGGTITVPSITTSAAGALALAGWVSSDNNSWSTPSAVWSLPGGQAQWRNNHGEDNSLALAYRVMTTGGATGSVSRTQGSGSDRGIHFRISWKQVPD
jgi:hypothetical protein